MEFVELTKKEFDKFEENHQQSSFNQTSAWGELKKCNGWTPVLLGLKDNKKIVAATLLLAKQLPIIHKKMFYAPRGFLIDYKNYDILREFTLNIRKYAKENKGIFIKIDPYIPYKERDIDGKIVEDGIDNEDAYKNLLKLGYHHFGFNVMQETLQPRWIFVTDTEKKTVDEVMKGMDSKTRQIIRKNERLCIKTREIGYDELDKFKDIMQRTGDRRKFIDRPLSYYQEMYKALSGDGIFKVLLAELHTKELLKSLKDEKDSYQKEYDERKHKHDDGINKMNEKKYESKQKETEKQIERVTKKQEEIKELNKKHGDVILLGGILFLVHGNEVVSLVGGSYEEFMEFQSAYTVHWAGCKYAIENGYKRYNFYGITGDFREENPLYGLYLFKRGYGGRVVELIGEFDLVISKFWYHAYKCAFSMYHKIKNIKNRD